jgi:hypothetical protein
VAGIHQHDTYLIEHDAQAYLKSAGLLSL